MPGPQQAAFATPRLEVGEALFEYMIDLGRFIATRALPVFRVDKKAGNYSAIPRETILRPTDTLRSAGSGYPRDTFESQDNIFSVVENGHETTLDDSESNKLIDDFDTFFAAAKISGNRIWTSMELRVAAKLFNTSTFSGVRFTNVSAVKAWSDRTADVIGDVIIAMEAVENRTGMTPNIMIINSITENFLRVNDQVLAAIAPTERTDRAVVLGRLAGLFGVDEVLVGKASSNTADEGQDAIVTRVWSDEFAFFAHVSEGQSIVEPGVGRIFQWTTDAPDIVTAEDYVEVQTRGHIFRVRQQTEEKIVDADFGHLLKIKV